MSGVGLRWGLDVRGSGMGLDLDLDLKLLVAVRVRRWHMSSESGMMV